MQPQNWKVAVSVEVIFLGSTLLGSDSYFSFFSHPHVGGDFCVISHSYKNSHNMALLRTSFLRTLTASVAIELAVAQLLSLTPHALVLPVTRNMASMTDSLSCYIWLVENISVCLLSIAILQNTPKHIISHRVNRSGLSWLLWARSS